MIFLINGINTPFMSPLPDEVTALTIVIPFGAMIRSHEKPAIVSWLQTLKDRITCSHIQINDILISTKEFPC